MRHVKSLSLVLFGALAAVSCALFAQQSGSGLPGGSNFSTQYKANATSFGGAGPGTAGHVLTSNGAGMAPSYQAAPGGTPGGANTQVQYNDAGAFGGDAGMVFNETTNDLTITGLMSSAGLTSTALVLTPASATGSAGLRLPHGAAPTSPTNGDTWTTTAGMFVRINGATVGPLSAGSAPTTGSFTITWDDACTVSPTTAVDYSQLGTVVTWRLGTMSGTNCTSDSSNFATTATIVPAGIRPTVQLQIPIPQVKNNSLDTQGCIVLRTNGTVAVDFTSTTACVGGSWTSSGSKNVVGYTPTSITYLQ